MVQKTVLDNGLRVISEQIPGAHSTSIGIWVEVGSRHEAPRLGGIAHFVEHMLFKGTDRRSARDIAGEIDAVGGVLNAFTGREHTCFYAKILADKVPLALDLLSDLVLNSTFDFDEIEKERRVILQEIHMVEDTPDDLIHDLFSQRFWSGNSLGASILGPEETVKALSRDDLLGFVNQHYCGAKLLICAAGAVDHGLLLDLVQSHFGSLSAGQARPRSETPRTVGGLHWLEKPLEQAHLCLGIGALPQNHPERFAAYALNVLLGGSMSSRLFQTIREERGLAYSIYSYLNTHSDAGALVVYAGTSPEDATEVTRIILRELSRFRTEEIRPASLRAAKDQLKGQLVLSLESTDSRMTRLAKNELYLGRHLDLPELLDCFEQVSASDILALAQATVKDEALHLQLIGPSGASVPPLVDLTVE
jgi:predicted Zn-dependent peptidase